MSSSTPVTPAPKQFRRQIIDLLHNREEIEAACLHAPPQGMCGGCSFQNRDYATQLEAKGQALRGLWAHDLPEERLARIGMIGSPQPIRYRTRMDYVATKGRFGLRRGGKFNYIVDLDQCWLLPEQAFNAARACYDYAMQLGLPDYNLRSHAGFLRYIVVRRSPQDNYLLAVVTADAAQAAVDQAQIEQLAAHVLAQTGVLGFHWLINDTKTDLSFGQPYRYWGAETLSMQVGIHHLQIGVNTFFQNNVYLMPGLLEGVATGLDIGSSSIGTVADLYGGVGTLAIGLSEKLGEIVTVESVEESARLAVHNIRENELSNVRAIHADVLDFLRAQAAGSFEAMIADPPRIGLGPQVCTEILRLKPQRLVYVSCNPLSQLEDMRMLANDYDLHSLQGYDMFPQTPHLEALGVLIRKL